ncbi:MlaA family lipoprotein [Novosphingobium terrae]|uniref:MlaA family lipoprotein n=1 Tax=Novosphingobium terrae TaxID=2726189 RepID=UPI00197F1322|nr:VacJ family lipoprotein [Novosphingobium terrae]
MSITGGARPPFPSRAGIAPVAEAREAQHHGTSRWLKGAALASAGLLGAWAAPALAGPADQATLTYAPLDSLQAADGAAQTAVPAPAFPAATTPSPAAADQPAQAPASTPPAAASADDKGSATGQHSTTPAPAHATSAPGDIVVSGERKAPAGDPLEGVNMKSYAVVQATDKAVVGPAAMAYKKTLPSPLRQGLHNVLYNLREPPVAVAFLAEHKFGKAFETVGRLAINTTIGLAGIFDIAKRKPFHLPRRANGIADAMGFYGIKPGPYFFLPLIGPTTLRDLIGTTIDRVGFPALYADELRGPAYGLAVTIIGGLDDRVMIDPELRVFRDAPDSYAAMRRFYLQHRQAEIDELHGIHTRPITAEEAVYGPSAAPDAAPAASLPPLMIPPIIQEPAPPPPPAPIMVSNPVVQPIPPGRHR